MKVGIDNGNESHNVYEEDEDNDFYRFFNEFDAIEWHTGQN